MNFLELPDELTGYERARYAVLPVGYDATVSYRGGTKLGPSAILDASQQVENFDEELLADATEAGIYTAAMSRPNVAGPKAMVDEVAEAARQIAADGKFMLGLGGEHSITSGFVRGVIEGMFSSRERKLAGTSHKPATKAEAIAPFGVLQIDAHADLRDQYEGSPWSHACVMRRLRDDLHLPTIGVGIRNFCRDEHEYMKAQGIEPMTPASIAADPAGWIARVLDALPPRIYITIDIDGLDPSIAPGTGTPEPGGLTWAQTLALLRQAFSAKQVVAADIVEVAPIPGQHVTEFLAARLAYKMIVYHHVLSAGK